MSPPDAGVNALNPCGSATIGRLMDSEKIMELERPSWSQDPYTKRGQVCVCLSSMGENTQ